MLNYALFYYFWYFANIPWYGPILQMHLVTRICTSLGLHMKFKTLFMSDESKLIFGNIPVVIGTNYIFLVFNKSEVWRAVNPPRIIERVCDQHQLMKHSLNFILKKKMCPSRSYVNCIFVHPVNLQNIRVPYAWVK